MPWGTTLVPVNELSRLLAERRRSARSRRQPATPGRSRVLPPELVRRIRSERAAGKSLRQIARELNASHTPTAHGGRQWWRPAPSGLTLSSAPDRHPGTRRGPAKLRDAPP